MKEFELRNMLSDSLRAVPNQFILKIKGNIYFQSYTKIICKITKHKVYLDKKYWKYTRSTSNYLNKFLNENDWEEKQHIFTNLN